MNNFKYVLCIVALFLSALVLDIGASPPTSENQITSEKSFSAPVQAPDTVNAGTVQIENQSFEVGYPPLTSYRYPLKTSQEPLALPETPVIALHKPPSNDTDL